MQIAWSERSEVKIPLRTRHPDTTETKYDVAAYNGTMCTVLEKLSFMAMRWTD